MTNCGILKPDHVLDSELRKYSESFKKLQSRRSLVPIARILLNNQIKLGIRVALGTNHQDCKSTSKLMVLFQSLYLANWNVFGYSSIACELVLDNLICSTSFFILTCKCGPSEQTINHLAPTLPRIGTM